MSIWNEIKAEVGSGGNDIIFSSKIEGTMVFRVYAHSSDDRFYQSFTQEYMGKKNTRYMLQVVEYTQVNGELEATPVLLVVPTSVMRTMADIAQGSELDPIVTTGKEAKGFVLKKTGTGLNTRYIVQLTNRTFELPDGPCDLDMQKAIDNLTKVKDQYSSQPQEDQADELF